MDPLVAGPQTVQAPQSAGAGPLLILGAAVAVFLWYVFRKSSPYGRRWA